VFGRGVLAAWDWAIPLLTDIITLALAAASALTNPPDTTNSAVWSALKGVSTAVNLAFSVLRGGIRIAGEVLCSASVRRRLLPWHRSGKAQLRAKSVRSGTSAVASGRGHVETLTPAGQTLGGDAALTRTYAAPWERFPDAAETEVALEADRHSRHAAQLQEVGAAAEVLRERFQRQWLHAAAACALIGAALVIVWGALFATAVDRARLESQTWALATGVSWQVLYTITLLPLAGCFALAAMVALHVGLRRKPASGLV
jgi:hypothetical protein